MIHNWSADLRDGVKTIYDEVTVDPQHYISAYDLLKTSGQHLVAYRSNLFLVTNSEDPDSDARIDLDNFIRFLSTDNEQMSFDAMINAQRKCFLVECNTSILDSSCSCEENLKYYVCHHVIAVLATQNKLSIFFYDSVYDSSNNKKFAI